MWNVISFWGVGVLKLLVGFLGVGDCFWFWKWDWVKFLVLSFVLKFLNWVFFIFLVIFNVLFLFVNIVGEIVGRFGDVFFDEEWFILK